MTRLTLRPLPVTVALAALTTLGCININAIAQPNGGSCSPGTGAGCPLGYTCDLPTSTCQYADPHDAAADVGKPDTAAGGGDGGQMCGTPAPRCAIEAGLFCDPVCQSGCGCGEKCSVTTPANGSPMLTCNVPLGPATRQIGESCLIASVGTSAQTDDCAPGLVCLQSNCGSTCFKHCRVNADCPASFCQIDVGDVGGSSLFKVCDVAPSVCNPVTELGPSHCPLAGQGCYVAGGGLSTICDCPTGGQSEGGPCALYSDCLPGLTCVASGGPGPACMRACQLDLVPNGCPAGKTCVPVSQFAKFGYCGN